MSIKKRACVNKKRVYTINDALKIVLKRIVAAMLAKTAASNKRGGYFFVSSLIRFVECSWVPFVLPVSSRQLSELLEGVVSRQNESAHSIEGSERIWHCFVMMLMCIG